MSIELTPRLRVSSRNRQRRRQERATAKGGGSGSGSGSANEVSRSNSFKFERYGGAASPEGAEQAGATTGGSLQQRKVGNDEICGHFTIC